MNINEAGIERHVFDKAADLERAAAEVLREWRKDDLSADAMSTLADALAEWVNIKAQSHLL